MSKSNIFKIAIIGSGPAGLSAATHAQSLDLSYIILESCAHSANTIRDYQKNKQVMAEPEILPLRSDLLFEADSREAVLSAWDNNIAEQSLNIRYHCFVTHITGQQGEFTIHLKSGECVMAEQIVLAIGLQGNYRQISPDICPPNLAVQYQLQDPDTYQNETILIIGAGDSAIENTLSLIDQNQVILVNRRAEFNRAKPANNKAILKAISQDKLECYYHTNLLSISDNHDENMPLRVRLKTQTGPTEIVCHRIIARLGAEPPRSLVEACGIKFPNLDSSAIPALSNQYESNVSGLYIIGALAGCPLIKQALNQGYEVIEFILGHHIEPADEPLLKQKFHALPVYHSVNESLNMIRYNMPLLSGLTLLQLRELMLESTMRLPETGELIFNYNDYSTTFFSIISGEVRIPINRNDPLQIVTLRQGQFFGEMGLISGRRRTATVYAGSGLQCVLIETPRRVMLKLINSVSSVKRSIDQAFVLRAIQSGIAPEIPATDLAAVVHSARIEQYSAGDFIFKEGDAGDCLHLIRSGSVTESRTVSGNDMVLSYIAAGNYVGEMALLSNTPRAITVRASVATETIRLEGEAFMALLDRSPSLRHRLEARFQSNLAQQERMQAQPEAGNMISFLVSQGLGEATDVLLINESLCTHCNNCENACADTHDGTSRLDRKAGPTYASLHVPTSCRHCEHPHCMKDCPPDAIHRAPNGEVFIGDNCIGCGNCEQNCPYGVIQMASPKKKKGFFLAWLLLGIGSAPGEAHTFDKDSHNKKAVKCDMCKDLNSGPACVRACPTGAAIRVSPEKFMKLATKR